MKKVLVFGVFDGLHEGHRSFLAQARKEGDYLIAVVTRDGAARKLKGRSPAHRFAARAAYLKRADGVDTVVAGDKTLGTWKVLDAHKPDVIALGYDQRALHEELAKHLAHASWRPKIKVMRPHRAKRFKSSILNAKTGSR